MLVRQQSQGFCSDFSFFRVGVLFVHGHISMYIWVRVDACFALNDSPLFCMEKHDTFWVFFCTPIAVLHMCLPSIHVHNGGMNFVLMY